MTCPACGWQYSVPAGRTEKEDEFSLDPGQLIVCWILAIPLVLGPYLAIWFLSPQWATPAFFARYYWVGWGIYLFLAWVFSPDPPPSRFDGSPVDWNLGIDPFHGMDTFDSVTAWAALALVPGKLVLAALIGLPRGLVQRHRLRAINRRLGREARLRTPRFGARRANPK